MNRGLLLFVFDPLPLLVVPPDCWLTPPRGSDDARDDGICPPMFRSATPGSRRQDSPSGTSRERPYIARWARGYRGSIQYLR